MSTVSSIGSSPEPYPLLKEPYHFTTDDRKIYGKVTTVGYETYTITCDRAVPYISDDEVRSARELVVHPAAFHKIHGTFQKGDQVAAIVNCNRVSHPIQLVTRSQGEGLSRIPEVPYTVQFKKGESSKSQEKKPKEKKEQSKLQTEWREGKKEAEAKKEEKEKEAKKGESSKSQEKKSKATDKKKG